MGFLDSVKAWLQKEGAELKETTDNVTSKLDQDLTRREKQLNETPEEAMARIQAQIDDDASFKAVRDRIDHTEAKAGAVADLNSEDPSGTGADTDPAILDLESTEVDLGDSTTDS